MNRIVALGFAAALIASMTLANAEDKPKKKTAKTPAAVVESKPVVLDRVVFGIELGKPLSVKECPRRADSKDVYVFSGDLKEPCIQLGKGNTVLVFPLNKDTWPPLVSPNSGGVVLKIIDGNVESAEFNTFGPMAAPRDLELLQNKYGKPTSVENSTVQN
ncbi:MAG: hypothetical protein NTX56_05280, partial [Proteobacteria bacterium]|nr:hypothetical protein [Pseudomonadota bacterium]